MLYTGRPGGKILAADDMLLRNIELYVKLDVLSVAGLHAIAGAGFLYFIVNEPVELVFIISTLIYIATLAGGYFVYERRGQSGW